MEGSLLKILIYIISSLGIQTAILLTVVYLARKKWSFMMTLNFQLAISIVFHNFPFYFDRFNTIVSESEVELINDSLCKALRAIHITSLSSCLVIITAINVIAWLVFKKPTFIHTKGVLLQQILTMVIWGVNIITVLIFLLQDQEEMEHKVCRTSLDKGATIFFLCLFIALILSSIIFFIMIKGNINEILEESEDETTKQKYKCQKYIWFFAQILMITNIVIFFIKQGIGEKYYVVLFYIDQYLEIISLLLLLNFYSVSKAFILELKDIFCCCCSKDQINKDLLVSFQELNN